jgi:hypothetical protein
MKYKELLANTVAFISCRCYAMSTEVSQVDVAFFRFLTFFIVSKV